MKKNSEHPVYIVRSPAGYSNGDGITTIIADTPERLIAAVGANTSVWFPSENKKTVLGSLCGSYSISDIQWWALFCAQRVQRPFGCNSALNQWVHTYLSESWMRKEDLEYFLNAARGSGPETVVASCVRSAWAAAEAALAGKDEPEVSEDGPLKVLKNELESAPRVSRAAQLAASWAVASIAEEGGDLEAVEAEKRWQAEALIEIVKMTNRSPAHMSTMKPAASPFFANRRSARMGRLHKETTR